MSESPDPVPLGLDPERIAEWVDVLRRDPVTRAIAEIASRTGRPFTVVEREFTMEDLTADAALSALKVAEAHRRCSQCGTRPEDFEDKHGRPVENPLWKLETWICEWCATIAEDVEREPESRRPHVRTATVPNDEMKRPF